ncbi:MAG: efflux RND transporter permease subunit [Novosphingobium meiothermophilum]
MRWAMLGVALLVCVIAGMGLRSLEIQHDYRRFVDAGNAELSLSDQLASITAGGRESLAIIYRPESGQVFESTSLLQLAKLADLASRMPHVDQQKSLLTARKLVRLSDSGTAASDRDRYRIVPFIHPDGLLEDAGFARMRGDAAALPSLGGRLVARDGSSALVLLAVNMGKDGSERQARLAALKDAVANARVDVQGLRGGDQVTLVGPALFDSALAEILSEDAMRLAPVGLVLFFVLLFALFRSMAQAAIVLGISIAACIAALGTLCWTGAPVTILVFSGLLLVATLSVAEALHVISGFSLRLGEGATRIEALEHTLDHNFWAICTTSATTAIGEAVLLYNSSPAVRTMGLVMIFGAFFAVFLTLTVVPALVLGTGQSGKGLGHSSIRALDRLGALCSRHPPRVLLATLAISALLLPGIANSFLHDSMAGWFSPRAEFRKGLDLLNRDYTAVQSFSIATEADNADREAASGWPVASELIERQQTFDRDLARMTGVRAALTPSQLRSAFEQAADGATSDRSSLVISTAQAAEAIDVAVPSVAMLEDAGVASPFEAGKRSYLLRTVDAGVSSNGDLLRVVDEVRAAAARTIPDRPTLAGGAAVVFARLGEDNIANTAQGTVLTIISITICMAFAFRSGRQALLSLAPNVLPVALVFGAWGWISGELNLAATTVLSVALGIVVDDTTHIFMKFDRLVRQGLDAATATALTMAQVSTPIVVTSVVLASGFALLGFSQFALTAQQSWMIAASILAAVLFDLTATPAMLALFADRQLGRKAMMEKQA